MDPALPPSTPIPTRAGRARRGRPARRTRSETSQARGSLFALLALQHFLAEIAPDAGEQLMEAPIELDVDEISRALEIDRVSAHNAAGRSGREDEHLVRERDRFLEIVSGEDDGLVGVCPERQELGLHSK